MSANKPGQGGFLTFNSLPPRLHITSDSSDFDPIFIQHLQQEGFDATYLPYSPSGGRKAYLNELKHLADDLELGESYAIIAFGSAAAECLEFHTKPQPKLSALICYYPTSIASPKTKYPPHLEVCVHLAGTQAFAPAFPSYTYKSAPVGFAEHDLPETFNKVAASLAWTRTLATLRKAFKLNESPNPKLDLGSIKESHAAQIFGMRSAEGAVAMMSGDDDVYVNCVPTMTGGIGHEDLLRFYSDYFISKNPPSLSIRLVSRTLGTDRVVDEMVLTFKHTQVVDWILPGVQPTNNLVHVAMVSIVTIRGGKLVHEHLYWDQASVLVQVGLLDPNLVPEGFAKQGVKRLPVYGAETASKALDVESQPSNNLIAEWKQKQQKPRQRRRQGGGSGGDAALPQRPKQAAAVNGTQAT